MGDHEAGDEQQGWWQRVGKARWRKVAVWALARLKAFAALASVTLLGYLATWLVDPGTTTTVESLLPPEFKWAVPPIMAVLVAVIVERQGNIRQPAGETQATE